MAVSSFTLRATRNGQLVVYTGRAGEGWVSANLAEAFTYGEAEAARKAALFNGRTAMHGLTFEAVAA